MVLAVDWTNRKDVLLSALTAACEKRGSPQHESHGSNRAGEKRVCHHCKGLSNTVAGAPARVNVTHT